MRLEPSPAIDPVDAAGGPLSTPGPNYPSVTPALMSSLAVPLVIVGETVNATCAGVFCKACAPSAENFQQYAHQVPRPLRVRGNRLILRKASQLPSGTR